MVRQRYIGVTDPQGDFNALRPFYRKLRAMQGSCVPLKADYLALDAVTAALRQAATHFTKDPYFYGGLPMTSFGSEPGQDESGGG